MISSDLQYDQDFLLGILRRTRTIAAVGVSPDPIRPSHYVGLYLSARGYRVARYVYPPGTVFPEHSHDVDKIDGVLSGRFRMTLRGGSVVLGAGDCLAVPRGTVHRAEVVGDEPVVSLDATRAGSQVSAGARGSTARR